MKRLIFVFTLGLMAFFISCNSSKKELSVTEFNPGLTDFSFLDNALKNKRIVALGQSSHGFGSMNLLKVEMIKHLYEKQEFDVLILEAGYGDVGLSWLHINDGDPRQLRNSSLYKAQRNEQMLPIFQYLKEKSDAEMPLVVGGMDPQISGQAFNFLLMDIVRRLEPKIIQDSIESGLSEIYKIFEKQENEKEWQEHKTKYIQAVSLAKSILTENREDIKEMELSTDEEVGYILRSLDLLEKLVQYNYQEVLPRSLEIRDSLMAENIFFMAEEVYPQKKVIIWGHNGHIEKANGEGDNIKWVGHYLKEKYKDKYYAMGIFAKKGEIFINKEEGVKPFDLADQQFIEAKVLEKYGQNVFIDLPSYNKNSTSWENQLISGYELECGGKVNFIPSIRFDGIIVLGETTATTFDTNEIR